MSDVGDLALMLSGDMSTLGGATNKTAEDYKQAERAAALMDIQEKLKSIFLESAPAVEKIAKALSIAANIVAKFSTEILILTGVYALYQIGQGLIAAGRKVMSVFRKADNASELAEINSITGAIKAQEKARESSTKLEKKGATASPISGMSAPLAVGLALIGLGLGFMAAGKGIAFMAEAMQDMSIGQIIAMAVPIGALAAAFYALAPSIVAAGGAAAGAALPMMAFGLAVTLIGAGIGIAAAGIGKMAEGIAVMFAAAEVNKVMALTGFIAAAALGSVGLIIAAAGFVAMAGGLLLVAGSLKLIATRDLEAIATFSESLGIY